MILLVCFAGGSVHETALVFCLKYVNIHIDTFYCGLFVTLNQADQICEICFVVLVQSDKAN